MNRPAENIILIHLYTFEEIFNQMNLNGVNLNKGILRQCVISMLLDIERSKGFHKIRFPDSHKYAAYTIKWIAKLRPIQINENISYTETLLLANEFFAIGTGLTFLNKTNLKNSPIKMKSISNDYLRNLVYTLHYRPIIGEVLASKIYLLEKAIHKINP